MTLQTDRLILRELSLIDIAGIHVLHSLPETDEFNTLGIPNCIQTTEKLVTEWLKEQNKNTRESYVLAIDLVDSKQFIGLIALNSGKQNYRTAEVWYKIHVDHWGKGYATEALIKLLHYGFNQLELHRIEAGCDVDNLASCKVLEKAGMIMEGKKRKKLPIRGQWKDNYFYAILEEDFLNKS